MNKVRKRAEKLFDDRFLGLNIEDNKTLIFDTMVEFAKEMCELQKQECADNVEFYHNISNNEISIRINKNSILNCKNVCDE
jgi:hypothetical protein